MTTLKILPASPSSSGVGLPLVSGGPGLQNATGTPSHIKTLKIQELNRNGNMQKNYEN